jgi:hypothetical protein
VDRVSGVRHGLSPANAQENHGDEASHQTFLNKHISAATRGF